MSYILDVYLLKNTIKCKVTRTSFFSSEVAEEKEIPFLFSNENRESILKYLLDLKEKYRIKQARLFLPLHMCLVSMIELPLRKKSDIDGALHFKLGSALPLPIEQYVYDYRVLERTKSSSKLMVLSIKKDIVSQAMHSVQDLGMKVTSIRCDFMEKLSMTSPERRKGNYILIHIESGTIDFAVVKKNICVELKHLSAISHVRSEIEKMQKLHDVKDVLLTGDVTDAIREEIGVSAIVKRRVEKKRSLLASPFLFEFLRPEIREGYRDRFRFYALSIAVVSAILIIAGYSLPVYRDYSELKKIDNQIKSIKTEASELIEKRKNLDSSRERVKFLKIREMRRALPLKMLGEVTEIIPADAWIMNFNVDEKGFFELKGFAENASRLVEILEESDMFRNVGFSAPILPSGEKTRFSIKMELEK